MDYATKQKLAANIEGQRQPAETATSTLTSLGLLRDMFGPGTAQRDEVEELMKSEASVLLSGISALMRGPNSGVLREQFGESLESASVVGRLIRQQQSEDAYGKTIRTALTDPQKKRLGLDQPEKRRELLATLVTRRA